MLADIPSLRVTISISPVRAAWGIFGVYAGYNATITNEGFIGGVRRYEGIEMGGGGLITNGSSTFTGAEIRGYLGVLMKYVSGSVTNFGLIEGVDSVYGFGDGIELNAGGVVRNGSVASRSAVIEGAAGVSAYYGTLDVHNYGLISGAGVNKSGVYLGEGGHVINGANTDATAIIQGGNGVFAPVGAAFVSNYGTITGHAVSGEAIFLGSGGAVNNGSGGDHAALIQGAVGVFIEGATGAVTNAGTILGDRWLQRHNGQRGIADQWLAEQSGRPDTGICRHLSVRRRARQQFRDDLRHGRSWLGSAPQRWCVRDQRRGGACGRIDRGLCRRQRLLQRRDGYQLRHDHRNGRRGGAIRGGHRRARSQRPLDFHRRGARRRRDIGPALGNGNNHRPVRRGRKRDRLGQHGHDHLPEFRNGGDLRRGDVHRQGCG